MSKVLVCPIAFNENVKLKKVIERFLESKAYGTVDYMVVDDCSTDGTTEVIASYAKDGVQTLRQKKQQGVGAAIRAAIHYARQKEYDVLVIMAGNDKDRPNEIPILLQAIEEGYDFVQGSRYLGENRIGGDMPFYRKLATRMHPFLMSLATRRKLTDTTNGFRAFRLSIFDDERMNIDQEWLDKYELEPYILFKSIKCGFRFREAPVTKIYPPKKLGYTKMKPIVGWWSILRPVIYLGLGIKK